MFLLESLAINIGRIRKMKKPKTLNLLKTPRAVEILNRNTIKASKLIPASENI